MAQKRDRLGRFAKENKRYMFTWIDVAVIAMLLGALLTILFNANGYFYASVMLVILIGFGFWTRSWDD